MLPDEIHYPDRRINNSTTRTKDYTENVKLRRLRPCNLVRTIYILFNILPHMTLANSGTFLVITDDATGRVSKTVTSLIFIAQSYDYDVTNLAPE